MGYYTSYALGLNYTEEKEGSVIIAASVEEDVTLQVIQDLFEISEDAADALDERGDSSVRTKWHGMEEDMRKISLMHAGIVFIMEGAGDAEGDLWKSYFLNGKHQSAPAEVIYPEFVPLKLN